MGLALACSQSRASRSIRTGTLSVNVSARMGSEAVVSMLRGDCLCWLLRCKVSPLVKCVWDEKNHSIKKVASERGRSFQAS